MRVLKHMFDRQFNIYSPPRLLNIDVWGTAVPFRKSLHFNVGAIFLYPEARLVVLDDDNSNWCAFPLITVYASSLRDRPDIFRCLEVFLVTARSLLLVGDLNASLDTHLDDVGRYRNRGCQCLKKLLRCFQLTHKGWTTRMCHCGRRTIESSCSDCI